MTLRGTLAALAIALAVPAHAEPAKGTLALGTRTASLAHAWLVVGPDAVDPKRTIRRVVFSATDIGAKLKACATMSCTDGSVGDGMTVDLDGGPRINYWVALNGQRVQHSGTVDPKALSSPGDDKRVAGRLAFDQSGSGGAKVDVAFDAPLAKRFDRP
jgi:hypothetical protein